MKEEGSGQPVAPERRTGELEARQGFVEPNEEELKAAREEGRAVLPETEGKTLRVIRVGHPLTREEDETVAPIVNFDPPQRKPEADDKVESR